MAADSKEKLKPQVEEKIEKAEWMNKDKINKKFLLKTYTSIAEVVEMYYMKESLAD
jgi:hypothetical protein